MSGILVLVCDESMWEFVTQTSYFVAISHMDSMSVWIIDPLRYYAFREKPPNYVQIEEPNGSRQNN
jgi:hypothetical protein